MPVYRKSEFMVASANFYLAISRCCIQCDMTIMERSLLCSGEESTTTINYNKIFGLAYGLLPACMGDSLPPILKMFSMLSCS